MKQNYTTQDEYVYKVITDADEIVLDEEFVRFFPKLDERSSADLEKSILKYGCLVPLVLWEGILIDGHNRYELLKKHRLGSILGCWRICIRGYRVGICENK